MIIPSTLTSESREITVSTIDSPPYYIANPRHSDKKGLAVDIVAEAFKASGADVSFDFIPMARAGWSLLEQNHSALLGTPEWFFAREKRAQLVIIDILPIDFVFFYKKSRFPEGFSYAEIEDLRDFNIGNIRGSSTLPYFHDAGICPSLVSDVELNLRKLQADRIDLAVGVKLTGWMILQELYPDTIEGFASTESPFFSSSIAMIFRKEDTELIDMFEKGLEEIMKNGTYHRIITGYGGDDAPQVP